ncbi:MAG: hypothetical protein D6736_07535 [Nitrospinota bacterium]|nr:MAG: hypothetical protein D6736_07535 [Nitrospinota bacterium]
MTHLARKAQYRWVLGLVRLLLCLLLSGCAALAQVKYTPFAPAEELRPPIRHPILLTSANTLDRDFVELGIIEVRGRADQSYLLQKMLEKAREVGADAVYKITGAGDIAPQQLEPVERRAGRSSPKPRQPERIQIDTGGGISLTPRVITGIAVRYR